MTAKRLDKKRPFGTVHGGAFILFEQDGLYFDANGRETSLDAAHMPPAPDDGDEEDTSALPPTEEPVVKYKEMPVVALKTLVESYGETYKNKATAIDFLEGKEAKEDEHKPDEN